MTNPDYTHVVLIIDRSGSMENTREDAQGGINALLREQYELPGKLTVTLTQFNTETDTVARMASKPLKYTLKPNGGTALYDAVGKEIQRTGEDLSSLPDDKRPSRVLIAIVTDGEENSSREFNRDHVRSMVDHQRYAYNWAFQFIGAEEAAWQGHDIGMAASQYTRNGAGNRSAYQAMSHAISQYREAPADMAIFEMPTFIEEGVNSAVGTVKKATATAKKTASSTAKRVSATAKSASASAKSVSSATAKTASAKTSNTVNKVASTAKTPVAVKAPAKKAPAKKAPVKKAPVKKAPVKKAPVTKKAPVAKKTTSSTAKKTAKKTTSAK